MKKRIFFGMLSCFVTTISFTQCLNATYGQYPAAIFNPTCNGLPEVIATDCYAGEFTVFFAESGHAYEFSSSVSSDWITLADSAGTMEIVSSQTPLTGIFASSDGYARFYVHTSDLCGEEAVDRSRIITCTNLSGLTNLSGVHMNVFPNPAKENITIRGNQVFDEMELVSIDGRILNVFHPSELETKIDLQGLEPGTYFVRIKANGEMATKEFIKL